MKPCRFIRYYLLILCTLAAVGAQAQPTVADFSIVSPSLVENETAFLIVVMESDSLGRLIAPGNTSTVTLTASVPDSSGNTPVSITPSSFVASGDGSDEVTVTLGAVASGTRVVVEAQGYGLSFAGGRQSGDIIVVDNTTFGTNTTGIEISAPPSANPNEPFPIFLTPVQRVENDHGTPTSFTAQIRLRAEHSSITPDTVNIDVSAGGSHLVYVTLDGIGPNISIHAQLAVTDPLESKENNVTFTNKNQAYLTTASAVFRSDVSIDSNFTLQGTLNVTTDSEWESRIWLIEEGDHPFDGDEGWNLLTKIPAAGFNGGDIHLHYILIPQSVPFDSLPGPLWSALSISTDAQNPDRWEPIQGSAAFPDSFSGDYWVRCWLIGEGDSPAIHTTFDADFNEFNTVLTLVEDDGETDNDEDEDETLADFYVKGSRWTTQMFEVRPSDQDPVFHMITDFLVPLVDDGEDTTGADQGPVTAILSFVPSNAELPILGAPVWNPGFLVEPTDFSDIAGDVLDSDFSGSYYMRFKVLSAPNGDGDNDLGWSNHINTTGELQFSTGIELAQAHGKPGETVTNTVVLRNEGGQTAAGLQFDVMAEPGVTFQGVINHLSGFSISSNPFQDRVKILMVSLEGNTIPPGQTTLMQLVYQLDDTLSLGRRINLTISESIISDANSQSIPHNTVNAHIDVGVKGDLANRDGVVDVTDLITLINMILRNIPVPQAGTFEHFLADLNSDGAINVIDVVRGVNIIIGNASSKQIAASTGPAVLHLSDLKSGDDGRLMLPIKSQFTGFVAGLELTLKYDPATIRIGDVQPTALLDRMTVEQSVSDGMIHIIIYSVDGRTFQSPSLSTLINIPVEFRGNNGGSIFVAQAIMAGPQAQSVALSITSSSVKVSKTPTSYALAYNLPNPFNPSTRISYDVPQPSQVRLTIYNLLGQEVVRLVDKVHAAGHYTVDWHGVNTQGHSVASGVYLYRLTSETGFTETKRMTLLK